MSSSNLAQHVGRRIRDARSALAGRWLERLATRVTVGPPQIFPTDELLDHMPLLIDGIGAFVEDSTQAIPADSAVVHHARELGALRHVQGFSEYEILKEFEILGGILFTVVKDEVARVGPMGDGTEIIACSHRLFQALALIQQSTTARFLELARERTTERENRLRAFNRALTHEMRNRISATLGAGQMLQSLDLSLDERASLSAVIVRNADNMRLILENLLELSRLDLDARQQRHVALPSAIQEVARQLRDLATDRAVDLRIEAPMPTVEVNAAVVELTLANLISNGIKYSDSSKAERWVAVSAKVGAEFDATQEVVVTVEDNGVGVPEVSLDRIFERFFRAENVLPVEGTGLGLSLVKDVVETVGGRVSAARTDRGSKFSFTLPCRRVTDPTAPQLAKSIT
ncbi:MAG TPA: sensor histidine kinase [Gemmatimonadaceae bacterium]